MKQKLTVEDVAEVKRYRKISGIMTAIAVAMYIMCWLPLVICGVIGESVGANAEMWGVLGLSVMMLIVAIATGILIINSYMKPVCLKNNKIVVVGDDYEDDDDWEGDENHKKNAGKRQEKSSVQIGVSGAVWLSALIGYLCLGFEKGLWHPGWIIFIVAIVVDKIIGVIFDIARKKRDNAE